MLLIVGYDTTSLPNHLLVIKNITIITVGYLGKLRLYGGGVNAILVKQRLYLLSNALVLQQTATSDVRCGDDAIA